MQDAALTTATQAPNCQHTGLMSTVQAVKPLKEFLEEMLSSQICTFRDGQPLSAAKLYDSGSGWTKVFVHYGTSDCVPDYGTS